MRYINILILIFFVAGCNQNNTTPAVTDTSTVKKKADTIVAAKPDTAITKKDVTDSAALAPNDTALLALSRQIFTVLKEKNYTKLVSFIYPGWHIRFSPYGHIDTLTDQAFSADTLLRWNKTQQKVYWGKYDGTGDSIKLGTKDYFKKFVYDADFLHADEKSVNQLMHNGGIFTNLQAMYPGCSFIHFYVAGTNPKYTGMDWKGLVLVFKKDGNGKAWLVGVVHDQWRV